MANTLFIQNSSIEDAIVLLAGLEIDGFDPDGAAITPTPLREAGQPSEGSGGYLCQGSAASETHVLAFRVLRGSNGFRRLRRLAAAGTSGRLSIRPRNLAPGDLNYDFYTCAYVTTSDGIGPNFDPTNKYATFTVYATGYRDQNVTII